MENLIFAKVLRLKLLINSFHVDQSLGILEENYDDVDEIKQKVNEINQNLDGAQNNEPICEESYDDLDTVVEQAQLQLKNGNMFIEITFT